MNPHHTELLKKLEGCCVNGWNGQKYYPTLNYPKAAKLLAPLVEAQAERSILKQQSSEYINKYWAEKARAEAAEEQVRTLRTALEEALEYVKEVSQARYLELKKFAAQTSETKETKS